MAAPSLPVLTRPQITIQVARAIVHLNFHETEQAQSVLFALLSDLNFEGKEIFDGHAAA